MVISLFRSIEYHSCRLGFVQFIDSQPLQKVFERTRTIRQYLQSKITVPTNADDPILTETGIPREMLDAYVKSCGMLFTFISLDESLLSLSPCVSSGI